MSDDARRREGPGKEGADIGHAPTVSPSAVPTAGLGESSAAPLPERIGRYQILGLLGEGGMGVVYEAEQPEPRRVVALKVIRGGAYVDETRLRLFQREADTLARLEHPNIAAIYESGRTEDGQHFFAMELVRGDTLHDYLQKRPETITPEELRGRLFLFRQIAGAVHYAHQRGVIHRDLKPANIIVTEDTASQDASASIAPLPAVKVLDFGLARITEGDMAATMTTEVGAIKGTLPYMSPEQARGRPEAIDLRTDVYALGVVLYEMLTGQLPYDVEKGGVPEALRVICEENPRPVSQIWSGAKRLDPDVETIIGKALEKEADRRYQSAAELAADVDRYLLSKPIEARPPSTIYQLRKFARRNRVLVGGVVATFIVLVAGVVVSTVLGLGQAAQRREAVAQRQASEASRLLMLGEREIETDPTRALAYAIASLEKADNVEVRRFALDALWRGPSYFEMGWEGPNTWIEWVDFSPDGEWLAMRQNGTGKTALWRPGADPAKFWDLGDQYARRYPLEAHFAPQSDSLYAGWLHDGALLELSVAEGGIVRRLEYDGVPGDGPPSSQFPLHVSSDGDRVISTAWKGSGGAPRGGTHLLSWSRGAEEPVVLGVWGKEEPNNIQVIDPAGKLLAYNVNGISFLRSLENSTLGSERRIEDNAGDRVTCLAFDPDGRHLGVGGHLGEIRVWPTQAIASAPLHVFDGEGSVRSLTFHPDGSILVSGHNGGGFYVWSLDDPTTVPPLELQHQDREFIHDVSLHPDGRWLANSYRQGAVVRPLGRTYPRVLVRDEDRARDNWNQGFAFSPDGTWIAASLLRPLRQIPLERSAGTRVVTLIEDIPRARTVVFDPAGRYVIAGGMPGGTVHFKPLNGGEHRKLSVTAGNAHALAVSRDGRLIAAGGNSPDGPFLRIWDTGTWDHRDLRTDDGVHDIEFTQDDRVIFAAGGDLYRWNRTDPDPELLAAGITENNRWGDGIDLSPDGRYVLASPFRQLVHDLETGTTRTLDSHRDAFHWVFDPTGTIVVSGGMDGVVRVGRANGEEPHWLVGHQGQVNEVAVSPDGQWILSSGGDGTLRLWPMPDLDRPPLHTLPHDELLERLRAQTNLRAVPDPESSTGYRIAWENPSFQSWDDVPTW